jgi:phospholipid/cholesterol/gamma-HCH transport system substrate-binding protein
MKTRNMEAAIGIVFFIASLVLIIGLIWLSEKTVGWRNYELKVLYTTVQGLKRGDPVYLVGVKIGRVEKPPTYRNGFAEVSIFLVDEQRVPRGSKFLLGSGGLITGKVINIVPSDSADYYVDGETVYGELVSGLEDLAPAIAGLEKRLHTSIDTLLGDANVDRMQATLRHVRATTAILEEILAQNQQNIALTMANLRAGSENLNKMFNHNFSKVDSAVANLTAATARLEAASRDFAATAASMKTASQALADKQGTLGALVYERSLHDSLTATMRNLNSLIEDIKRHPQKYVKVTVF